VEPAPVLRCAPDVTYVTLEPPRGGARTSEGGRNVKVRNGWLLKLLALVAAIGLIAAACGDSDDEGGEEGGTATTGEEVGAGTTEAGTDTTGGEGTEDTEGTDAAGEAAHGGTLVYGIEADSANPWTHYGTSCAISCRMIFRAITEPLFIENEDADIVPYLVDTVESNADLTEWTMTIKDGITFQDGTPLDGEAVAYNLLTCKASPLTGPAFTFVSGATGEGQTVTVTYSQPDALGPQLLRGEVCGMMFSKEWLMTLENNPLRNPESPFFDQATADTPADGDSAAPVGLGPFQYVSYTPGNGNSFVTERYADYWRGDGPNSVTGEGLPYLDGVEFVVAVDIQGRSNGLQSGQFDIIHTANGDEIAKFVDDDAFTTIQADDFAETSYILLNVGAGENPTLAAIRGVDSLPMDPGGLNASSPLLIESCRIALAQAIDRDRLAEERNAGLAVAANGPFAPGSVGYLEDTGYPEFDVAAAQATMETCLSEAGSDSIEFSFNTTNDPFNVESNTLVASMWTDAFGDQVQASIQPIEQGQYIGLALAGVFQAQGWRNHAGLDPTEQWFWWSSATSSPINPEAGELALNFGRFQDPEIDAALQVILTDPDPAARQEAAEEVNRQFGQHVYNFWSWWTIWGIIANERVQNVTDLPLPDGGTSFPVIAGKHYLAQVWCTDGDCQG
jgi:peptide/nickel transport system substrate-binding protein